MNDKTAQVTYSKLGDHRGHKRVWLEGKKLADIGFVRHQPYSVLVNEETKKILLRLDPEGERKVAGRKRGDKEIPILDFSNETVTKLFKGASKVKATFNTNGTILIEMHHEDIKLNDREDRLKKNGKAGKVTEGSACSGAAVFAAAMKQGMAEGGLESSLEWIIDRDGSYLQVALDNNTAIDDDTVIFEASLEELEPELLAPVDVFQFSLPCTGHSIAGKSKNKIGRAEEHPTDATAVFGVMASIKATNPAIISSENVVEAQGSATYMLIKAELQRMGYAIHEFILDNEQAGSFEQRKRYWFLAVSNGIDALANIADIQLTTYGRTYNNLGELLEPVPADDKSWSDNQYLKDKAVTDKAAGKGFANRQLLTEEATSCGTIGRHYNKRRSTEPFLVRAEDSKERLLTPVEHCRVKDVPESLVKGVAPTTAHQLLGQSGLWNSARGMGNLIADIILRVTAVPKPA